MDDLRNLILDEHPKPLRVLGGVMEAVAGFPGGVMVALATCAALWFFHAEKAYGLAVLIPGAIGAFLIFPLLGLLFRRRFIPFVEPIANQMAMGCPLDPDDDWPEWVCLAAYCLSLVALAIGTIFHSWFFFLGGAIVFVIYGWIAPGVFHLRLASDPPARKRLAPPLPPGNS